jgi:hypothetical protein
MGYSQYVLARLTSTLWSHADGCSIAVHVVDPDTFPLDAAAQYKPKAHTLDQAHAFLGQLGIEKMVIVSAIRPSPTSDRSLNAFCRSNQAFTATTTHVRLTV